MQGFSESGSNQQGPFGCNYGLGLRIVQAGQDVGGLS